MSDITTLEGANAFTRQLAADARSSQEELDDRALIHAMRGSRGDLKAADLLRSLAEASAAQYDATTRAIGEATIATSRARGPIAGLAAVPASMCPHSWSYIYLMEVPAGSEVAWKIGRSVDPWRRSSAIGGSHLRRATLVGAFVSADPKRTERTVQGMFSEHHIRNELFRPAAPIESLFEWHPLALELGDLESNRPTPREAVAKMAAWVEGAVG